MPWSGAALLQNVPLMVEMTKAIVDIATRQGPCQKHDWVGTKAQKILKTLLNGYRILACFT